MYDSTKHNNMLNLIYENEENIKLLQSFYGENLFVFMKSFFNSDACGIIKKIVEKLPGTRVLCGASKRSWNEIAILEEHPLHNLLSVMLSKIVSKIGCFDEKKFSFLKIWYNIYSEGEYIEKHTDANGDIQLVICLEATSFESGGILHILSNENYHPILMSPGDALLFKATKVTHYTTPIKKNNFNLKRKVIVLRFYF